MDYQGIHDRFLRDHDFRARMIENSRDEEVCRAWDVFADEDHTYHLSQAEYFHYKNKWWLHLNKSGSDTLPLRKRSDFKQALSTLERLHQEGWRRTTRAHSLLEEQTMEVGIEFVLDMVGMTRLLVVFLKIRKVKEDASKGFRWLSRIHSILLQIDRLQLTAVYWNRWGCKDNTSKDPCSRCETCNSFGELTMTGHNRITTSRRKLGSTFAW